MLLDPNKARARSSTVSLEPNKAALGPYDPRKMLRGSNSMLLNLACILLDLTKSILNLTTLANSRRWDGLFPDYTQYPATPNR